MVDATAMLRVIAEYADTLAGPYEVADVLYRLSDQVTELLGIDGAGVSLADEHDVLRFATATDARIAAVEERQVDVGQGPCHDAYRSRAVTVATDLDAEDRWPDFTPVARAQGCAAAAGIPMAVAGRAIGAMNLYCRAPRIWSREELDVAEVLASMATGYIVNARTHTEEQRLSDQLQHALASRIPIEQAKGVLAERHGVDPTAAFELLRRHARDHNRQLVEVARAVIDHRLQL